MSISPLGGPPRLPGRMPRRAGRNSKLGWALGLIGGIVVIMLAIGFGVQEQAAHHVIPGATAAASAGVTAVSLAGPAGAPHTL